LHSKTILSADTPETDEILKPKTSFLTTLRFQPLRPPPATVSPANVPLDIDGFPPEVIESAAVGTTIPGLAEATPVWVPALESSVIEVELARDAIT
jgi:hypothetical protein